MPSFKNLSDYFYVSLNLVAFDQIQLDTAFLRQPASFWFISLRFKNLPLMSLNFCISFFPQIDPHDWMIFSSKVQLSFPFLH